MVKSTAAWNINSEDFIQVSQKVDHFVEDLTIVATRKVFDRIIRNESLKQLLRCFVVGLVSYVSSLVLTICP